MLLSLLAHISVPGKRRLEELRSDRQIELAQNRTLGELSIGSSILLDKCIGDDAHVEKETMGGVKRVLITNRTDSTDCQPKF
jgi:hypothetical protein